jgi:hypothetical protein
LRKGDRRHDEERFCLPLWDCLSIEVQKALIEAGVVDPAKVQMWENPRFGIRLVLLANVEDELKRTMEKRPEGDYAVYISGGPLRPADET